VGSGSGGGGGSALGVGSPDGVATGADDDGLALPVTVTAGAAGAKNGGAPVVDRSGALPMTPAPSCGAGRAASPSTQPAQITTGRPSPTMSARTAFGDNCTPENRSRHPFGYGDAESDTSDVPSGRIVASGDMVASFTRATLNPAD
jgi:hypothetical protein